MNLFELAKRLKNKPGNIEIRRKDWISKDEKGNENGQEQDCFFDSTRDQFSCERDSDDFFMFTPKEIAADDWEYCQVKWVSK